MKINYFIMCSLFIHLKLEKNAFPLFCIDFLSKILLFFIAKLGLFVKVQTFQKLASLNMQLDKYCEYIQNYLSSIFYHERQRYQKQIIFIFSTKSNQIAK